jgi:hypothetical protein
MKWRDLLQEICISKTNFVNYTGRCVMKLMQIKLYEAIITQLNTHSYRICEFTAFLQTLSHNISLTLLRSISVSSYRIGRGGGAIAHKTSDYYPVHSRKFQ